MALMEPLTSHEHTKVVKADVLLNGKPVDPVDSTVFLGITIDFKLQWGYSNNICPAEASFSCHL